jgi:signal transduction histidine kinase
MELEAMGVTHDQAGFTARRLLHAAPYVGTRATCGQVAQMFQDDPSLPAIVILADEERRIPAGLADRSTFLLHFAQRYGRDLYAKRPVLHLGDRQPLLVPLDADLAEISDRIGREKPDALHRGFILVDEAGAYAGIGLGIDVMRLTAERTALALEQLRETQRELIQSEKMAALGGLVAGVAHEINTPLGVAVTAVTAFAQETEKFRAAYQSGKLRRTDLEEYVQSAGEALGFVQGNITRAADLVQAFKQVAVDQTSDLPRHFDLGDYVGEVLRSLVPRLRRSPHWLDTYLPPGVLVYSAPGAFAQIITNLVMNALTHAFDTEPGIIAIRLTDGPGPDQLQLSISDNGCGIPQSDLPHIFDPFFTTRRDQGGTGLGLHVVYNLVTQRLRGRIEVESKPGQGTSFLINFPRRLPRELQ